MDFFIKFVASFIWASINLGNPTNKNIKPLRRMGNNLNNCGIIFARPAIAFNGIK
jgi:hypothetical protein